MKRITLIGGFGNYGAVLTTMLARHHDVTVLQDPADLHPVRELRRPGPRPYGHLAQKLTAPNTRIAFNMPDDHSPSGTAVPLAPVTTDYSCVKLCDAIVVATPSTFHETLGKNLRPFLAHDHPRILITFTDRAFGGYSIYLHAECPHNLLIIGASSTPMTAYKDSSEESIIVHVSKNNVSVGVYPGNRTDLALDEMNSLLPDLCHYRRLSGVLELALDSNPAILHAVHELSIIKHIIGGRSIKIYSKEHFGPNVESRIHAISDERCRIADAWDVPSRSFFDYEKTTYATSGMTFDSLVEHRTMKPMFQNLTAPIGLRRSKGIEAVICALCVWESMAHAVDIDSPEITRCIDDWEKATGIALRSYGRSLESLRLAGRTPGEIKQIVYSGDS